MAVSSTTSTVEVTLTSDEQAVAIPFVFYNASEIVVVANGVTQVSGTDYNITGGSGSTGTCTMTAAGPVEDDEVIIYRSIPNTHTSTYSAAGPMSGTDITRDIDRAYYILQQLRRDIDLSLRLAIGQTSQSPITLGDDPQIFGHDGDGVLTGLAIEDVITLLNLPETVVDRPLKVWADNAARAAAVPDYVGQIGVQVDAIGSALLTGVYIGTATTAGSWTAVKVAEGNLHSSVFGVTSTTACVGNDSRLSDARTPTSHTHGAITNAGAIGSTSGLPIKTGASGVLEAGAFGVASGQFAEGNHNHSTSKLAQANTHESPDTDAGPTSLHHTLGTGANQAAAGNHTHAMSGLTNSPYALKGRTYLTSGTGATFTPAENVRAFEVEVIGGGGAGGNCDNENTGTRSSIGAPGGGGGYARKMYTNLAQTFTYTVGAGGAVSGAASGTGGTGGTTSFVASTDGTMQATGGAGGVGMVATATTARPLGGAGGVGSGGACDIGLTGSNGGMSRILAGAVEHIGTSGAAPIIGGGRAPVTDPNTGSNGATGANYGEGGGASYRNDDDGTDYTGGAGGAGLIIITEYY